MPGGRGRARYALYSLIIVGVVILTYVCKAGAEGIFSCQADGYAAGRYLAYCHARAYGDYEHGAFWFRLEPPTWKFAAAAKVLFLGNSRTQYAFSSPATADWFSSAAVPYYLLGFAYYENATFEGKLLARMKPKALVYVINVDQFFEHRETPLAMSVIGDYDSRVRYEVKHFWQFVHRPICTRLAAMCGDHEAIFRSRRTGAWWREGKAAFDAKPVSYDGSIDRHEAQDDAKAAADFFAHLPVKKECVILTIVPTARTKIGTARALAAAAAANFVAPQLDELKTFDGSHLDRQSAERWSRAFFQMAGSRIRACTNNSPDARP